MFLTRQNKETLARRRKADEQFSASLEQNIVRVESVLIGLTIAAIAYADWLSGPGLSVGFLYLIPLSYSALSQRWLTTACLVFLCVVLRQWLSPLELSPWTAFIRDWVLTAIFVGLVAALGRLGQQRRSFFEASRRQRDELMKEVELAAEVQEAVLQRPRPQHTNLDISAHVKPAKVVGGDFYDLFELGESSLALVLADVSGKGLAAAMMMPAVDVSAQMLALRSQDPAWVLAELNQILFSKTGQANYATVFFGIFDPRARRLHYSNGGHLPGIVIHARDGSMEWLKAGGPPVGLLDDAAFEGGEVRIEPGDVLLLYSDGVTEVENLEEEPFGEQRLADLLVNLREKTAAEIAAAIEKEVELFRDGESAIDDATVIVVKAVEPKDA